MIKNLAGWSQRSKVFDNFYNRPIVSNKYDFAKTVIASLTIEFLPVFLFSLRLRNTQRRRDHTYIVSLERIKAHPVVS